jgi:hypothetical protein
VAASIYLKSENAIAKSRFKCFCIGKFFWPIPKAASDDDVPFGARAMKKG